MLDAFHGLGGIGRVVDRMIDLAIEDPRIAGTLVRHDLVRLRQVLKEQFAFIPGAPIDYSCPDMATSHRDIGLQAADLREPADRHDPGERRLPRPGPVPGQAGPHEARCRHPPIPQRNKSVAHRPWSGPR